MTLRQVRIKMDSLTRVKPPPKISLELSDCESGEDGSSIEFDFEVSRRHNELELSITPKVVAGWALSFVSAQFDQSHDEGSLKDSRLTFYFISISACRYWAAKCHHHEHIMGLMAHLKNENDS